MNSLLAGSYADDNAASRSHAHYGLIMADYHLADELSVATIEFTDTPE